MIDEHVRGRFLLGRRLEHDLPEKSIACSRRSKLKSTGYYIAIAGLDGSGKTTISKALIARNGESSQYLWFRFSHITSASLLALARLLGATRKEGVLFRHRFGNHAVIRFLYPRMLYVDMRINAFLRVRVPTRTGRVIIIDRCPIDSVVDLAIDLEDEDFVESSMADRFRELLPPNRGLSILIETSIGNIVRRRRELRNDTTLEMRERLYRRVSESWRIPRVSNDRDIELTLMQVEQATRGLKK